MDNCLTQNFLESLLHSTHKGLLKSTMSRSVIANVCLFVSHMSLTTSGKA